MRNPLHIRAAHPVSRAVLAVAAILAALALLPVVLLSPARAADGDGIVRLDFSGGTIVPPWTAQQAVAPDRLQLLSDPLGGPGIVARFEVREGDQLTSGNRTEVYYKPGGVGAERVGEESYYAFSIYFPPGFVPPTTWGIVTQMHAADSAGTFPVVALETRGTGALRLVVRGGNPKKLVATLIDFPDITTGAGVWHDFILDWRRSTGADGLVRLWHRNGTEPFALRATYAGPNFYADKKGRTEPAYIKQGMYRDGVGDGTHPSVAFHRGMWKAPTLDGAAGFFGCSVAAPCF